MTLEQGSNTPESQRLALNLIDTVRNNQLGVNMHQYGTPFRGIPIPPNTEIDLKQSDPQHPEQLHLKVLDNGSLRVAPMSPYDYGMGMDTMWFGFETLIVSPDGKVEKVIDGYPNIYSGYMHHMFDQETTPQRQELDEQQSLRLLAELQKVAEHAIQLKNSGELEPESDYNRKQQRLARIDAQYR